METTHRGLPIFMPCYGVHTYTHGRRESTRDFQPIIDPPIAHIADSAGSFLLFQLFHTGGCGKEATKVTHSLRGEGIRRVVNGPNCGEAVFAMFYAEAPKRHLDAALTASPQPAAWRIFTHVENVEYFAVAARSQWLHNISMTNFSESVPDRKDPS